MRWSIVVLYLASMASSIVLFLQCIVLLFFCFFAVLYMATMANSIVFIVLYFVVLYCIVFCIVLCCCSVLGFYGQRCVVLCNVVELFSASMANMVLCCVVLFCIVVMYSASMANSVFVLCCVVVVLCCIAVL